LENRIQSIVPLGDQALLAYFADEEAALGFARRVGATNESWIVDVVSAYSSVAVFFDLERVNFESVKERMMALMNERASLTISKKSILHRIPCCYEFEMDLEVVAKHTGLASNEIIRLHSEREYRVYAIGFCPGFPFLGYLPDELSGVPRLASPRLQVAAGSIGLTGRQTGIYTLPRPGGWNLIGRTPLELVNVHDNYFPLHAGDRVHFERIDEKEFRRLEGERL
jgi:inhibitor of KinA